MLGALIVVNLAICTLAFTFQVLLIRRSWRGGGYRRFIRVIGACASLFFMGVYIYELCRGLVPGVEIIRPALTLFFAYVSSEAIHEYIVNRR